MTDIIKLVGETCVNSPDLLKDRDALAVQVLGAIPEEDRAGLLQELLVSYIKTHNRALRLRAGLISRRASGSVQPRREAVRTAQRAASAQIMTEAGKRPLFLPALVSDSHDGWVAYDDMTPDYWREYIRSRDQIARVSGTLAKWGSQNLQALGEYKAATSGQLPEQVRISLLRRQPPARDALVPQVDRPQRPALQGQVVRSA